MHNTSTGQSHESLLGTCFAVVAGSTKTFIIPTRPSVTPPASSAITRFSPLVQLKCGFRELYLLRYPVGAAHVENNVTRTRLRAFVPLRLCPVSSSQ